MMSTMNTKYPLISSGAFFIGLMLFILASGCKKGLPEDRESIGLDTRFTQTVYSPVLGRNTLFSDNLFVGASSQPLNFKILNMRTRDGSPAPELTKNTPVQVWSQPYLQRLLKPNQILDMFLMLKCLTPVAADISGTLN
jgi:hypothetical protein